MQKAVFIGADPKVAEIVRLGICLRWPKVTPMVASTGTSGLEMVKEEGLEYLTELQRHADQLSSRP